MSISQILQSGIAEANGSGAKQVELQPPPRGRSRRARERDVGVPARPTRPPVRCQRLDRGLPVERRGHRLVGQGSRADDGGTAPDTSNPAAPDLRSARRTRAHRQAGRPVCGCRRLPGATRRGGAPATAEAAAASEGVGAWILRLDPGVWNLTRFIADGHREVSTWAVEDNERSAAMTRGQRVFLWAGGDGTLIMPGVWGAGWVVGPCQSKSVADGYWVDPAGNSQRSLFADVSIQLLPHPVGRQQVVDDPRLAAIEVLRDPFGSNPSSLTPEEAAAMLALVGLDPPAWLAADDPGWRAGVQGLPYFT